MTDAARTVRNVGSVTSKPKPWWADAVFYQVYPRSFQDSTGSGTGDLRGITSRLHYLEDLGIDALWLSPFYPSPQVDAGYDVSDYCDVDPLFGSLEDFKDLLKEAHGRGMKVIVDVVPNHSSDQHPLFQAALGAPAGSPERQMYHFVQGRGATGDEPPNNWQSVFGGPSWTRVSEQDGAPGQWYYHLFAAEQPDFNWENPAVAEFFEGVFRFWLDLGVDGFRIDVSDALFKDTTWPDTDSGSPVIFKDKSDPIHDVYRWLRELFDQYDGDRMAVIETGAEDHVVAQFLRPDEMHQAFNFRFLKTGWNGPALARAIKESMEAFSDVGAPATWVTDNHDTTRSVTRYSSSNSLSGAYVPTGDANPESAANLLGEKRARAMALLFLALPGSAYIYQGQELGLPEVTDLPEEVLTDPAFFRSGGQVRGRDGCRVPLPWSGQIPPFGFSTKGVTAWLPQPSTWEKLTAQSQQRDEGSMLSWYQRLLQLRRDEPSLGSGRLQWVSDPDDPEAEQIHLRLLSEGRPLELVVNLGSKPVPLPDGIIVAASGETPAGVLPPDTSALLAID